MTYDVAHLTILHEIDDNRIFHKEVQSLRKLYKVLLVAPESNIEISDSISFKKRRGIKRALAHIDILRLAYKSKAQIIHYHDPELFFVAGILKLCQRTIIFDSHEDVPQDMLNKPYLNSLLRIVFYTALIGITKIIGLWFDAIICATEEIASRFPAHKTTVVKNFARGSEFSSDTININPLEMEYDFIYVGTISEDRGILQILESLSKIKSNRKIKSIVVGPIHSSSLERKIKEMSKDIDVTFTGSLSRRKLLSFLSASKIAMVTLHPTSTYIESLPVKLFEYMMAGRHIIASNFSKWKSIAGEIDNIEFVDPLDTDVIANAMQNGLKITSNEYSANARKSMQFAQANYSWESQAAILFEVYRRLNREKNSHSESVR
ncbi:glycosyltransferase [Deinococcus aerophilus]|uniref:Glycosyl transferase n=1 Tax=Deinococcus aerophilus TaxID=522488 RepID=A0ABQ2GU59_9DEIO|nr:glycosyltransferase [Deinococcus aerophilus]GGM13447.1 glycosyl transferase [Deinococcus aerophilus]